MLKNEAGRYSGSFALFTDISSQKKAEEQLQLAASVFASTQEAILIADADGNIIDVNHAFTQGNRTNYREVART